MTAPSTAINSTTVQVVNGVPQPRYGSSSGTSMAGPHSAAALALVMQRFPYMTNKQALYTMFTTGRQNNTISDAAGAAVPNPTRGQMVQVPDRRNGWHTPSLREAVQGPGPAARAVRHRHAGTQRRLVERHLRRRHPGAPAGGRRRSGRLGGDEGRQGMDAAACLPTRATPTGRTSPSARGASRHATRASTRAASRSAAAEPCSSPATTRGTATSTVLAGKLSVVGSHASSIDVGGGTLGGSGTVAGSIDVAGGVLQPGLAPQEAASIGAVPRQRPHRRRERHHRAGTAASP